MFDNRNILITGGTGSFGKEFVKTILTNYKPKKLILIEWNETNLYMITQKLLQKGFDKKIIIPVLGNIQNYQHEDVGLGFGGGVDNYRGFEIGFYR